jgi:hypothetical protein
MRRNGGIRDYGPDGELPDRHVLGHASARGHALVGLEPHLPEPWTEDRDWDLCRDAGISDGVDFTTKPSPFSYCAMDRWYLEDQLSGHLLVTNGQPSTIQQAWGNCGEGSFDSRWSSRLYR